MAERQAWRCSGLDRAPCGRDLRALELLFEHARAADDSGRLVLDALEREGFKVHRPPWEVDHADPLWAGGSDRQENLRALCQLCHREATKDGARWRRWAGRRTIAALPRRQWKTGPDPRTKLARSLPIVSRRLGRPEWACRGSGRAGRLLHRPEQLPAG